MASDPALIRSILAVRRDPVTRPVMKATLRDALKEREKIRRAGWFGVVAILALKE